MVIHKQLILICFFIFGINVTYSQFGFSHEIGVIAGPVEFKSDFGSRNEEKTNLGNSGVGIGIIHYINFAYRADCSCYTTDNYFNDHFKLRNEISWNRTTLDHHGFWVQSDKVSENADRLRGHHGVANNFDIGTQIEFFPKSIRSFQNFGYRFAPFISLGVHFTAYNPKVSTDFVSPNPDVIFGDVTDPRNFYSFWEPGSVNAKSGTTWSMVTSVGVRYKLTKLSDLMLDLRWQYYFNDWVDGLNHNFRDFNKNNDWLLWLNFGYIYYLN
jgi:hypothetical protein